MGMTDQVASMREALKRQTLERFERMRARSELVVFSDHFGEQRRARVADMTDRQIHRVVANGEVRKVGPGKYNHWKVEVKGRSAGDLVTVVCEVRDDMLVLITCWEGTGDGPLE